MRKIQVYLTIISIIVYALLAPVFRPSLDLFWLLLALLAILTLLARNYLDLLLIAFTALNMFAHLQLHPALSDFRHIAQTSAFTALTFLHLTLLTGPIAKLSKRFAPQLKHRRHVGVSVFLLAFVHANFIIASYYNFDLSALYAVSSNYFGATALLILMVMAFTSMNYFQHKMSLHAYSLLHTGLLVFYIIYTAGLIRLGLPQFQLWQLLFVFVFIIFWLATAPWSLPKKIFLRVNGWKQLHYLVYIAYTSIIVHAWTGYFVLEEQLMQAFFWSMVIVVVMVHLYGWVVRLQKSRELKKRIAKTS